MSDSEPTAAGGERVSGDDAGGDGLSRRRVLAAIGASAIPAAWSTAGVTTSAATRRDPADADIVVRVYPSAVPATARLRYGTIRGQGATFPVYEDAIEAVRDAIEQVVSHAEAATALGELEAVVEAGVPVDLPTTARLRAGDVGPRIPWTREAIADAFHEELAARDVLGESTCHLLLWWGPANYDLGYGGTRPAASHFGASPEGAQTVANVGATDVWDSRAVTRNMAIHETIHTFLSTDVVEAVLDSRCEHDLGNAVRVDEHTLRISPMATAYAGPDELGGGTRFHGTGCYDHDAFARHDGHEGITRFRYTTELSEATLEAAALYLERHVF